MDSFKREIFFKRVVKYMTLIFIYCTGLGILFYFLNRIRKDRIIILMYHSVSKYRRYATNVEPEEFKEQIDFLVNNYNIVSLDEILNHINKKIPIRERSVAITFDEGYRDNFTNALPLLKKHKIPATIFLVVDYIGGDKILPHDLDNDPSHVRLLIWEEIKQMSEDGITFGSHTLTHRNLVRIKSEEIREEVLNSKLEIEARLGKPSKYFAYPYGSMADFDDRIKKIILESGYTCALTTVNKTNTLNSDIYELSRIGIEMDDTPFLFKKKLDGTLDVLSLKDTKIGKGLTRLLGQFLHIK